jgi:hypothetical protein
MENRQPISRTTSRDSKVGLTYGLVYNAERIRKGELKGVTQVIEEDATPIK